jgi:hypothetical protein
MMDSLVWVQQPTQLFFHDEDVLEHVAVVVSSPRMIKHPHHDVASVMLRSAALPARIELAAPLAAGVAGLRLHLLALAALADVT